MSPRSEAVKLNSNVHPMIFSYAVEENNLNFQSNTTYFVLVTTCNSAGCSQDCGNTTIRTGPGGMSPVCVGVQVCLHTCVCVGVLSRCRCGCLFVSVIVWNTIIILIIIIIHALDHVAVHDSNPTKGVCLENLQLPTYRYLM